MAFWRHICYHVLYLVDAYIYLWCTKLNTITCLKLSKGEQRIKPSVSYSRQKILSRSAAKVDNIIQVFDWESKIIWQRQNVLSALTHQQNKDQLASFAAVDANFAQVIYCPTDYAVIRLATSDVIAVVQIFPAAGERTKYIKSQQSNESRNGHMTFNYYVGVTSAFDFFISAVTLTVNWKM